MKPRYRVGAILLRGVSLLLMVALLPVARPAQGQAGTFATGLQPSTTDAPLIFGGREAEPGAWPWQAALVVASSTNVYLGQYCGGTLIAPEWVLTAAHCLEDATPADVDVVLGRHELSDPGGERIHSATILIHPDYDPDDFDYDVGLIRLAQPSVQTPVVLFTDTAKMEESEFAGAIVVGWGLRESFAFPDPLFQVTVPLVSRDICNEYEIFDGLLTENMLCSGYPKEYIGPCFGDSGGPLMARKAATESWQQIGVVSFGGACGFINNYAAYMRVARFDPWIRDCLIDATTAVCTGRDDFEPDDRPQQAAALQTTGVRQTHNFHNRADRDWVRYEAQAGTVYLIETQVQKAQCDTLLWLYDSDGASPLAFDDDGGEGYAARLVWRAPHTGTFYVELQDIAHTPRQDSEYSVRIIPLGGLAYLPLISQ